MQQRVAITLWCLATPTEYRTIAHLFGVARSTVCEIVHKTCSAIVESLMGTYIKFPIGSQLEEVTEKFQMKWGVPQCVGAIDGCHIPIAAPVDNHIDYYNRKGFWFYKVLLMLTIVFWTDGLEVCMMHVSLCILHCTAESLKRTYCRVNLCQ